ncbi:MAG: hydantoinase/oxoprolinase family protein [Alphaproteobacteria bacterium]|nr:hydantoinase/oxoprolinase family protein [Alphaproteobacteria bacterium]
MIRLGIDVGGTHTDAVVMNDSTVVGTHKAATSTDVATGIVAAAEAVRADCGLPRSAIDAVIIGTTQFTNAIVQRRGLAPVFALRVGAQSTAALPPFCDWPADLRAAVRGGVAMIDGGHEYDGKPIRPLDETALGDAYAALGAARLESLAVCSVFSFVNPAIESRIYAEVRRRSLVPHISLSGELGGVGIHQRENATLLNAALRPMAQQVLAAYRDALKKLGLPARLFISQNDGTLMDAGFAARYPVLTISSGPTNSMRGAAHLTGLADAMVIDVGGTTSDIGMLAGGVPRRSGGEVTVGGVATNFRMPDVLSIGLGGGSKVTPDGRTVGPVSVGHELARRALCFGGDVLTATDVAHASGLASFGSRGRELRLDPGMVRNAMVTIESAFAAAVDRMKITPADLPLIAVGGAAFLVPEKLAGVSRVVRPHYAQVANAVGAAMAKVGAEAEVVYTRGNDNRDTALERARHDATAKAVAAGASRETIEITDVDEVPISYLDEPVVRLRIRAVGEMQL